MPDRERVIRAVDSCFDYWLDQHRNLHPLELETVRQFKAEALALLKEQDKIIQNILLEKVNELNDKVTTLQIEVQNREMRRLLDRHE